MSMKLYVGNLAFQTSSEDLQQLFAQAGTVESASVVEDRDTGRSRGFGFVEMASKEEGEAAIAQFNGKEFNGRNLTVNEARPREDRGNRGAAADAVDLAADAAAAVAVTVIVAVAAVDAAAVVAATAAAVVVVGIANHAGNLLTKLLPVEQ